MAFSARLVPLAVAGQSSPRAAQTVAVPYRGFEMFR